MGHNDLDNLKLSPAERYLGLLVTALIIVFAILSSVDFMMGK
jgi:hypothetical protein